MFGFSGSKMTMVERKSYVRVFVTRWAAIYVFGGSALLIAALWIEGLDSDKLQTAKDIYMTVLPVATGVVTYWFASRGLSKNEGNNELKKPGGEHEDVPMQESEMNMQNGQD